MFSFQFIKKLFTKAAADNKNSEAKDLTFQNLTDSKVDIPHTKNMISRNFFYHLLDPFLTLEDAYALCQTNKIIAETYYYHHIKIQMQIYKKDYIKELKAITYHLSFDNDELLKKSILSSSHLGELREIYFSFKKKSHFPNDVTGDLDEEWLPKNLTASLSFKHFYLAILESVYWGCSTGLIIFLGGYWFQLGWEKDDKDIYIGASLFSFGGVGISGYLLANLPDLDLKFFYELSKIEKRLKALRNNYHRFFPMLAAPTENTDSIEDALVPQENHVKKFK